MLDIELRAPPGGFGAALWCARDPCELRREGPGCALAARAPFDAAQTHGPRRRARGQAPA
eukprot:9499317-Pyramimonas_sp.AAC.1